MTQARTGEAGGCIPPASGTPETTITGILQRYPHARGTEISLMALAVIEMAERHTGLEVLCLLIATGRDRVEALISFKGGQTRSIKTTFG
jgi:hypothetical protein